MVLPLPGALTSFNQVASRAIEALNAIQGSIPFAPQTVQANVSKAVEESITTEIGTIFDSVPSFVNDAAGQFLSNFSGPQSLSISGQLNALQGIFGTGVTAGAAVQEFLGANARLEDLLPAQQLYLISQNLNSASLFADPLQAYTQVNSATNDIRNLCLEATDIITNLLQQLTDLLSVQTTLDYNQIQAANREFFGESASKVNRAIELLSIVDGTFNARGRFDAQEIQDLCEAINDFTDFVMFANSKFLQFEILRKSVLEGLARLEAIFFQIIEVVTDVSGFVPTYIASTLTGKIFRAVQGKVLSQSGVDLQKILDLMAQLSGLSADDRTKHLAIFGAVASMQAIKGFICKLNPSVDVVSKPEFVPFKAEYDTLSAALSAANLDTVFGDFQTQKNNFERVASTAFIRDNTGDYGAASTALTVALLAASGALTGVCAASDVFLAFFSTETALNPDRVVGSQDLFNQIGADHAANLAKSASVGDSTDLPISEATSVGQLAESVRARVVELPDGNEKERLTLLHSDLQARHRATIVSMDFQRRQSVTTFLAADREAEDQALINKTIETFSGLDENEFDQIDLP